jgi:hypothetical protein
MAAESADAGDPEKVEVIGFRMGPGPAGKVERIVQVHTRG